MGRALDLRLTAEVDGAVVEFGSLLKGPTKRKVGAYALRIARGELLRVEIARRDGREMDVARFRFALTVPLLNFSRVIVPDCGRFYVDRLRSLRLRSSVFETSAADDGMPFIAFVGQEGGVKLSFGLASDLIETRFRCTAPRISARGALLGGEDTLIFEAEKPSGFRYGRRSKLCEDVYLAGESPTWFHALRDYASVLRRKMGITYPERPEAWEPSWCTWTAWPSDLMSEERILANAREAAKLGIRHIILDDGWFGPGLDTDTAPLNLGDYYPDPRKIKDLPGLVRKLQALGLRALLWYAPPCVSPDSRLYQRAGHLVMMKAGQPMLAPNGFHLLCPRNPEARAHMASEARRMTRDYGVDGFKTDLYNCYPAGRCEAPHEHDCESVIEGLHRMMSLIWKTVLEENPRALIELKQNYGNVIAAQYGTMVRAGDTAYDVDTNVERCFHTLAYAPVVHNDYLAWSAHDTPRELAIMLIKMMAAGVPTFSRDLPGLPEAQRSVLRAWLRFYLAHLDLFRGPREPQNGELSVWQIGSGERWIIAAIRCAAEVRLLSKMKRVAVLNGSGSSEVTVVLDEPGRFDGTGYDHRRRQVWRRTTSVQGRLALPVPPGGMIVLRRKGGCGPRSRASGPAAGRPRPCLDL